MNSGKSETSAIDAYSDANSNIASHNLHASTPKRQRVDPPSLIDVESQLGNDPEYQEALSVLQEKKRRSLYFVKTQHDSLVECANSLATYEEERINEVYAEKLAVLQKKLQESNQVKTRRMAADEARNPQNGVGDQISQSNTHRKEMCYLTVPLSEDEMVSDLQYMAHCTMQLCDRVGIPHICVAAPLSGNRLLLNEKVIEPNTPCILRNGNNVIRNCVFSSTIVKEKDNKEKRKEPEVVINVVINV